MKELNRTMVAGLLVSAILMICIPMAAAESTIVSMEDATAPAGGTVKVPIRIADVTNLCGVNIWLYYDTAVATVEEVEITDPNPENGTSSIDNETGVAKMVWDTTDRKTDDFVFAYVTLKAVGAEDDECTLGLNVRELYDCNLADIQPSVQNGTFEVSGSDDLMEGDVTGDKHVTITDAMYIAQNITGAILGADQMKCADTNDDGSVTITDAMHIAQYTVDPTGSLGILFEPLWKSPEDDDMLPPVQ